MEIVHALVLGLLQGFTEFLPVSSSAHLSLAPWAFGWQDPGLAFDVALHFGTLIAVLGYFRAEWASLAAATVEILRTRRIDAPEKRRVVHLVIATIPGGLAGLAFKDMAETVFRAPALTATALIVMGTLLWAVDKWSVQVRPLDGVRWRDALLIGCAQMFAIIPGVSRSGSTITAARAQFDSTAARTPWMRYFITYEPLPTLRRVKQPVLILQGATDQQIRAEEAQLIELALRGSGNKRVATHVFPDRNHLFLRDADGNPSGYAKLTDARVDGEVLGALADWLVSTLRVR